MTVYETVFPTIMGIFSSLTNSERISPLRLFEVCLAVTTVPCTITISAPASTAIGAWRLAFCGTNETAAMAPFFLISSTLLEIKFFLIGSE